MKKALTALLLVAVLVFPEFTFATTYVGTTGAKVNGFTKVDIIACLKATGVTIPAGGPYDVTSIGISGADNSGTKGTFRLAVYSSDLATVIAQGSAASTFTAVDTWQEQTTVSPGITQTSQLISGVSYRICMTDTNVGNFIHDTQSGGGGGSIGVNNNGSGNVVVAGFSNGLTVSGNDNTDFMFRIGIDAAASAAVSEVNRTDGTKEQQTGTIEIMSGTIEM